MSIEKRKHPRMPYSSHHEIAPYRGGPLPTSDQFFPVICHDISRGGFSFLTDRVPETTSFVLAMTVAEKQVFVSATVMNHRQHEDGTRYIVGCKFNDRVAELQTNLSEVSD